jgi:hypothetical protein
MHLHCGRRPQRGWTVRARAPYIDSTGSGGKKYGLIAPPGASTLTHRLQSLDCVPLGSDVVCAFGKNFDCAYRESSRALRLLHAPASGFAPCLAAAAAAAWPQCRLRLQRCCRCTPVQMAVRRRAAPITRESGDPGVLSGESQSPETAGESPLSVTLSTACTAVYRPVRLSH